ncbi:MAG: leucine-rich repeat domain-containing protein [Verrucomicrobiota bacterium]|jgi:hypothetical protein
MNVPLSSIYFGVDVESDGGIPTAPWWQSVFNCTTNDRAITITGDSGVCGTMTVTIPASINGLPVTGIASNVFGNFTNLTSVYFHGNAPTADPTAFSSDANATVYYSPAGAGWSSTFAGFPTVAWWQAIFDWTTNAGAITIINYTGPGGAVSFPTNLNGLPVTSIGLNAFYECSNVTRVTIPGSITSIGNSAFEFCSSLTNVTIPESVTRIGDFAFAECGLESVSMRGDAPPAEYSPPPADAPTLFA